ncbi:MAG: ABC transporter substrate-binding protein [Chloroflexota bacterium]
MPIDEAGDVAAATAAAEAAIAAGLDGVVGPYSSGVGLAVLPLFLDAGIVPIHLTTVNETSGLGFTLQPKAYQIAPVAAEALGTWLGATNVALLVDDTQAYTTTIAGDVARELDARGIASTTSAIVPGREDYADVAAAVMTGGYDAVYLVAYTPEGGRIAAALHAAGSTVACLADYRAYDAAYVTFAGIPAAPACPVVGVPAPDDFLNAGSFFAALDTAFRQAPGSWTPYTYDSVMFLAEGITRARGTDATAVTDALDRTRSWLGWTGAITIDPETGDRDPATVVVARSDDAGTLHTDLDWVVAVDAEL